MEDSRDFIEMTIKQYKANDGVRAGIWYKGELAGIIGCPSIDRKNSKTSVGYWLGDGFQGKGIMTISCRAFVTYLLDEIKLNRVEISCATENKKSRAIPERLGFKNEGILRQKEWLYDYYVDHAIYSIIKGDKLK